MSPLENNRSPSTRLQAASWWSPRLNSCRRHFARLVYCIPTALRSAFEDLTAAKVTPRLLRPGRYEKMAEIRAIKGRLAQEMPLSRLAAGSAGLCAVGLVRTRCVETTSSPASRSASILRGFVGHQAAPSESRVALASPQRIGAPLISAEPAIRRRGRCRSPGPAGGRRDLVAVPFPRPS